MTDHVARPKPITIHRTPNPACGACVAMRQHTADEWTRYHPDAGHGCVDGRWTRPELASNVRTS